MASGSRGLVPHALAVALAYGFLPAFHFAAYRPFIVPALGRGEPFPHAPVLLAVAMVLGVLGAYTGLRMGAVHALFLALWANVVRQWLGAANEPGHLKDAEVTSVGAFSLEALPGLVFQALVAYCFIASGHALREAARRHRAARSAVLEHQPPPAGA